MNTILTDPLTWVADQLEAELAKGTELEAAAFAVLKAIMEEHSAVVFGGNGYAEAWHKMAVEGRNGGCFNKADDGYDQQVRRCDQQA